MVAGFRLGDARNPVGIVYLRATARRTKSGELVRYLQLAHNERNERGVPVGRVIHNFGREDRLDREALVRLVASIQRFLGGEETLRARTPEGFEFVRAPESGGPHVVDSLWSQLGIGKAITRVAGRGRGRSGVERAIFTMVCQRWSRRRSWKRPAGSAATSSSTASTESPTTSCIGRWTSCLPVRSGCRSRSSSRSPTCSTSRST